MRRGGVGEDLERLVDNPGAGSRGCPDERQPHRPPREVVAVERGIAHGDVRRQVVLRAGPDLANARDVEEGVGARGLGSAVRAGSEVAVVAASLPYMSRAKLWPRSAERTSPVSAINCWRAKSIRSSGRGARTDCAKLRADLPLAGEGGEGDPDDGHQGERCQDQDQDDTAATSRCRCEGVRKHLIGPSRFIDVLPVVTWPSLSRP